MNLFIEMHSLVYNKTVSILELQPITSALYISVRAAVLKVLDQMIREQFK